ncbi:MAG: hypothetical protein KatS3mg054_0067 [Chloroflexus sp.]|nr:MAG: hypothetical protein KatS3mg054_0067 [Chloroflexus sp.]
MSDEELYQQLLNAISIVFYRSLSNGVVITPAQWRYYRVIMEPAGDDCSRAGLPVDVGYGCEGVWRSREPLPTVLKTSNRDLIEVPGLLEYMPGLMEHPWGRQRAYWMIVNGRLYIWGLKVDDLKSIEVRAVPYDPVAWEAYSECGHVSGECVDVYDVDIPTLADNRYFSMAVELVMQAMRMRSTTDGTRLKQIEQNT